MFRFLDLLLVSGSLVIVAGLMMTKTHSKDMANP